MGRKNNGIPRKLRNDYKNLPLRERIKVLQTARRLLKAQKEGDGSMLKNGYLSPNGDNKKARREK